MTTEKMLQEIQDKIGDKSLTRGCRFTYLYKEGDYTTSSHGFIFQNNKHSDCEDMWGLMLYNPVLEAYELKFFDDLLLVEEIIGHPISLVRVLSALGDLYYGYYNKQIIKAIFDEDGNNVGVSDNICSRKLLKEDNSDCMLSDQSPDTIKAIWEIVCKS